MRTTFLHFLTQFLMLLKTTIAGLFFLILSLAAPRAQAQRVVVVKEQPRHAVVVRRHYRRAPRRVIVRQQPRRTVIVRERR